MWQHAKIARADPSLRYTSNLAGTLSNQPTDTHYPKDRIRWAEVPPPSPSYPKECPLLPKGQDTVGKGVPSYPKDRIQWAEVSPLTQRTGYGGQRCPPLTQRSAPLLLKGVSPSYPKDRIRWPEVFPSYPKECPPLSQRTVPLLPKGQDTVS